MAGGHHGSVAGRFWNCAGFGEGGGGGSSLGLGAGVGAGPVARVSGDSSGFFGAARRAIGAVGVGGALGFAVSLAGAGDVVIALVLLVAWALAGRGVGSRLVGFDFVASADAGSARLSRGRLHREPR